MADPFSVLTGAITVIGAALKICQVTEDFIKGIKGAPEAVAKLSSDVAALRGILKTLEELLSNGDNLRNTALLNFLPKLHLPLGHCTEALDDVERGLRPFVKALSREGGSKWRASSAAVLFKYREKDMQSLRRALISSQSMLDSAVQVVHLSTSTEEFRNIKRLITDGRDAELASVINTDFDGSSAIHSDFGFAMKRWLCDTTTVAPPSPPSSVAGAESKLVQDASAKEAENEPRIPPSPKDRWTQIREETAARRAQAQQHNRHAFQDKSDGVEESDEETIESRVARVKARVAELTQNV